MGLFSFLFGRSRSMTDNYIGRNGEFDRNDENLDILEDMLSMDVCNEEADLEEHYGWENVLGYESEGLDEYADELRDDYDRDDHDWGCSDDYGTSSSDFGYHDDSDGGYGGDYGDSDW